MDRETRNGKRETTRASLPALVAAVLSMCSASVGGAVETTLPNGARVIAEERPASETVAVRLLVGGGQLDEPDGRHGVADIHAAMLLRGTREKTGFALARAAEELGGRLTARARAAAESIAIEVPAGNAGPAIRLVIETLLSPRLDAADLAKEKALLAGSLATARDEPKTLLDDAFYRTLFPSHALARLASLTEAELRPIRIEDVRAFHRARLDAGRLALIAVGRCSMAQVESLASELLGALPRAAASGGRLLGPVLSSPPPLAEDVRRRVSHRTTQPTLVIGLPTSGVSERDRPALLLLRHLLTGSDERLYSEIRDKRGYAYWIRSEGLELGSAGAFGVSTGAKERYFPEIEEIVRRELSRIAAQPVSSEELTRAVRYVRTAEAREDETNPGRVGVIANDLVEGAPVRTYEERVARLAAVTPGEIRELARRLFEGKHLAVVTLY
jgi:predicted Zn-dependent peptidase